MVSKSHLSVRYCLTSLLPKAGRDFDYRETYGTSCIYQALNRLKLAPA
ncbi:MAG: hypothetical protein IPM42_07205 [Saprospiraceae bacterium]|nr:hypothetical protein [Saprospiraceae bacterium]